jgi:hypothetical protein
MFLQLADGMISILTSFFSNNLSEQASQALNQSVSLANERKADLRPCHGVDAMNQGLSLDQAP